MSATAVGRRTEPLIGARALLAVQTLEVGRLSGHVVPLAAGAFIPVSGEGDRADSNGSGKTTFLAAVALLLGDPQWRLGNAAGDELVSLLFDPVSAGGAARGIAPASHGYVIGAFEQDGEARTAWLRINRERRRSDGPLQVRVYEGLHLVVGDNDRQRLELADEHWRSHPALSESGLRSYARELYGEGVRVSAYVRTRGGRGSGPSLLAAEVDQFDEAQIGEELLRLSGQEEILRHDEQQRRERAETRRELSEAEREDEATSSREDAQLAELDAVDKARAAVRDAERSWDDHFAVQMTALSQAIAGGEVELASAQQELVAAALERERAQRAVNELGDERELRAAHRDVREAQEQAAEAALKAAGDARERQRELAELRERLKAARAEARSWQGESVAELEPRCAAADERAAQADDVARRAGAEHDRAEEHLAEVLRGGRVRAARAAAVLRQAGFAAEGLLDAMQLPPDFQARLEPALWPWRDAVAVAESERERAIAALSETPGALLISGPPAPLPAGVSVPAGASGFVARLLSDSEQLDGAVAGAADPAVAVIAPLRAPLTGRDAAVASAREQLEVVGLGVQSATAELEAATREARLLREELERARAAALAGQLADEEAQASERHLQAEKAERVAAGQQQALVDELDAITRRLAGLESARQLADGALSAARARHEQAQAALRELGSHQASRRRALAANPYSERAEQAAARSAVIGRDESTLRKDTGDALTTALSYLDINPMSGEGAERHDVAIMQVVRRRRGLLDDDERAPSASWAQVAAPLRDYLAGRQARDGELRERIERARSSRRRQIEALQEGLEREETELHHLAESIESAVRTVLGRISARYDALDRATGGHGAELKVELQAPADSGEWLVAVEPRWARGPGDRPVSYRRPGNTAMKKQRTINLVLAALLGDEQERSAGVLILDELGDSLGQQHRLEVLGAIAQTARERGITVLATCQDSMLEAAGRFAGQVVYFRFAGGHELVNRAPVLYGFDRGQRVRMSAEALLAGRPLA